MGGRREEEEVGRCELDRVGIDFLRPEKKTTRQRACRYGTVSRFGRPLDLFHARPRLRHYSEVMAAAPPPPLPRPSPAHPDPCSLPPGSLHPKTGSAESVQACRRCRSASSKLLQSLPDVEVVWSSLRGLPSWLLPPPPPSAAVSQGSPHWHVRYENAVLSGRAAEGQFRKDNVADAR